MTPETERRVIKVLLVLIAIATAFLARALIMKGAAPCG